MAEFGFGAAVALSPEQWVAGAKKATKATDKFTKSADKLDKKTKKAGERFDKAGKKSKRLGGNLNILKGAATGVFAGLAVGALLSGLSSALDAWRLQEDAIRQVEQRLKSTGGAVGLTSQELQDMATEMQAVTGIGDELFLSASSLLLTFTKIGGEVFPQTVEITADLAVAMATARGGAVDMSAAAIQLGKALNDPVANLGALSRAGIQFTKVQKETIKGLVESGNLLEAQKIILGELQTQFGGSARAARRETSALTNAVGDLAEEVGRNLDPIVQALAKTFRGWVEALIAGIKAVREWGSETKAQLGGVSGAVNLMRAIFARAMADMLDVLIDLERGFRELVNSGLGGLAELLGVELPKVSEEAGQGLRDLADGMRAVADEQFDIAIDKSNAALARTQPEALAAAKAVDAVALSAKEAKAALDALALKAGLGAGVERALFNRVFPPQAIEGFGDELRMMTTTSLVEGFLNAEPGFQVAAERVAGFFKTAMGNVGQFIAQEWQGLLAGAASGIISALQGGGTGGAFGSIGGALGGIFGGGPIGELIGGQLGSLVDDLVGGLFESAERARITLTQAGDDIQAILTENKGGLEGVARQFADGFISAIDNLESIIGAQFEIGGGGLSIRVEDELITVMINGLAETFASVNEAVEFALTQAIQSGAVGAGASPEVVAVLSQFAGDTIEGLNEELAKALRLQELRQGPIVTAMEAKVGELFELLTFAISKGISGAGVIGALDDMRDSILGVAMSAEERKRAEIDAFNASIEVRIAELEAMAAVMQAEVALTETRVGGSQVLVDTALATAQAMGLLGEQIGVVGQISVASAGLQASAAAGLADAIAGLQGLLIGADEAAAAIRAAGRRTGGGRGGRGSGRGAARDAFRDQAELLALTTSGMDEAKIAAALFEIEIRELTEQMQDAHLPAREQARLIELLTLEEQQRIEALENALPALGASIEDLFGGAAGFLANALGDQEILADLERLNFLERLEQLRTEFELLEARALLEGELTAAQLEKLRILRDLFDRVGEDLPNILDGFATTVEQAGQAFAAAVALGPSGFTEGTLADQAFEFLQALDDMQAGLDEVTSPIAAINATFADLLVQATAMAPVFINFGTSLDEVTQQLQDLKDQQIAQLFDPANASIQDFVDSVRGGPLSSLSDRAQFDIAAVGIQDLIAQAASGDAEIALAARNQLAEQLAGFADLAQAGLLQGADPFLQGLADQLEALGLGPAVRGGVPEPLKNLIGGAERFDNRRDDLLTKILDAVVGGNTADDGRQAETVRFTRKLIAQGDRKIIQNEVRNDEASRVGANLR